MMSLIQLGVFALTLVVLGLLTWWRYRRPHTHSADAGKEIFLAGGGLSWVYVAGSITITNLGAEQLVGSNGNQMMVLAWWELSAVVGLLILAYVFVPIYYRHDCTTTTELLERRYSDQNIRALISLLLILAYVLVGLPSALYTGGLFLKTVFGIDLPLVVLGAGIAALGAAYGLSGGLRAIAISETFSGTGLLVICSLITVLALAAIGFDLSGVPPERLTLIGSNDSPIPWHTLLTGMVFIQIFYWSTNQAITQRAMAAPTIAEAQKGVLAAAAIRLMVIPAIVVLPGVVAYKLYGDVNDAAFGRLVGGVMPPWLSGVFAAVLLTSVATHFVAMLNSTNALYVCDIHQKYVRADLDVGRANAILSGIFIAMALAMVPVYAHAESITNLLQQLNGLTSMPILSAFIVGLLFRGVDARSAIAGVIFGCGLYGTFTFVHAPFGLHYIHLMFLTLWTTVGFALAFNRFVCGKRATLRLQSPGRRRPDLA